MPRATTPILLALSSLAACSPSELDCYVSPCGAGATSSAASSSSGASSSGAGGNASTPCGSFGPLRQLVASTPAPSAVAVDATHVYWIDARGAYRVAKDVAAPLSTPKQFAPTYQEPASNPDPGCVGYDVPPVSLALTSDLVLWTLWDHCAKLQPWGPFLRVAPKATGMQSPWGEGQSLRFWGKGIAVSGKRAYVSAYFQHDAQPNIVDLDPSIPDVASPTFLVTPYDAETLGVSGSYLYFNDTLRVGLFRAPRAALGSTETIDAKGAVSKIVVDPEAGVFFVSDANVKHYDDAAKKTAVLAAEPVETPSDLAVDGSCAYWALPSGRVRAVVKTGGAPFDLAKQPATSVAADAQGVYWADTQSGTVWMLPRAN